MLTIYLNSDTSSFLLRKSTLFWNNCQLEVLMILLRSEHAIHAILASRMILHIRELASRDPFSTWELSTTGSSENHARPYQA